MSQGDAADNGNGWFSGWIQSAKEKSTAALNVVKRDLAEFTSTMHDDSLKVAASVKGKLTHENATAATEKVKQGVSTILGGISKVLVVEPDDDYQMAKIVGGEAVVFDRYKARLHAIQVDPTTYTADPSPDDAYQAWLSTFDLETAKGNISELLVSNVEVRALYTQMVPMTVSNIDFWSHYYFKCHQLEEEEARRVELMKRADLVDGEKEMGWDEDDDDDDDDFTEVSSGPGETDTFTDNRTSSLDAGHSADVSLADDRHVDNAPSVQSHTETTAGSAVSNTSLIATTANETSDAQAQNTSCPEPVLSITDQCAAAGNGSAVVAATVSADGESVVSSTSHSSSDPSWSGVSSDNVKSDSLVVVGITPDRTSPSDEGSNAKESLDEDWEKDFDVEVTEQELQAAKERLKNQAATIPSLTDQAEKGEDWEDW